jgi:hypothetical protein
MSHQKEKTCCNWGEKIAAQTLVAVIFNIYRKKGKAKFLTDDGMINMVLKKESNLVSSCLPNMIHNSCYQNMQINKKKDKTIHLRVYINCCELFNH